MEDDLTSFHNDLLAAVDAGVPIEVGSRTFPSKPLAVADIKRLGQQYSSRQGDLPDRYLAAIETWKQTGAMVPVLEGLSVRARAWQALGRVFRKALIYVLIVAVMSLFGLIHFRNYVLPSIEQMRYDLVSMSRNFEPTEINLVLYLQIAIVVVCVFLLMLIVWLFIGGTARTGYWLGGSSYVRSRTLAIACRIMQLLVVSGMSRDQAVSLGARLVGLDDVGQGEILYTTKEMDRESVLSPHWSNYLTMIADRQFLAIKSSRPMVLTLSLGGMIAFIYVLLAFLPVVALMYDIARQVKA